MNLSKYEYKPHRRLKRHFSPGLRIVSLLLVIAFAAQDLSYAQGDLAWVTKNAPHGSAGIPSLPKALALSHGTNVTGSKETLVHIEDAHDSLEAQEKIASILDVLASDYDVRSVAVEGSSGEMDQALFKTFPDQPAARE